MYETLIVSPLEDEVQIIINEKLEQHDVYLYRVHFIMKSDCLYLLKIN